jgi:DNA-binding SARP family transcriptional activator
MRNLLNRLRTSCGELVERDGEALVLAPGTEVDARLFERDAVAVSEADPPARPGLARSALTRYRGELLPQDRYESWATAPRERLRRRSLELIDLLVDDASERGEIDEAIRLLDRAIAAEPLDEDRQLRAAELLLFQGRRGSARSLVERAAGVRAELGLEPSPRLERLRAATTGT